MRSDGAGILRLLWRMLGREQDVLDAYQDCFCKLAQRERLDDLRSARAYAYRTASNIATEMIRARLRQRRHWPSVVKQKSAASEAQANPADAGRGEPAAPPAETTGPLGGLREALAQLPAHLRNVIVLRDLSQMSYADVARILRIDPATARVYRRHAVVRLAELMTEEGRLFGPGD